MHTADILGAIHLKAFRGPIQIWRIGITNDPVEAKKYWEVRNESTAHWSEWQAESLMEARSIEQLFLDRGMKRGSAGVVAADGVTYVYVF